MKQKPEVTRCGALDMQVCVPNSWTDEQVKEFADQECHPERTCKKCNWIFPTEKGYKMHVAKGCKGRPEGVEGW